MDGRGLITDRSAEAERMFGWSRADAIGRELAAMVIPARHRDGHRRGLERFLATGTGPILASASSSWPFAGTGTSSRSS